MTPKILSTVVLVCVALFVGCSGGGTEGTGVTKVLIRGQVVDSNGAPYSDATLVIRESGDSSFTDRDGNFTLRPVRGLSRYTFDIARSIFHSTAVLENLPVNASSIEVSISVNDNENTAEARLIKLSTISQFALRAEIVNDCKDAFSESNGELVQTKFIPNGKSCQARATVRGDGRLIGGVKVAIQRRECRESAPWVTTEVGITSTRRNLGTTVIPFTFFTTERACQYRIFAPFNQESETTDFVRIRTFEEQSQ